MIYLIQQNYFLSTRFLYNKYPEHQKNPFFLSMYIADNCNHLLHIFESTEKVWQLLTKTVTLQNIINEHTFTPFTSNKKICIFFVLYYLKYIIQSFIWNSLSSNTIFYKCILFWCKSNDMFQQIRGKLYKFDLPFIAKFLIF